MVSRSKAKYMSGLKAEGVELIIMFSARLRHEQKQHSNKIQQYIDNTLLLE
jgi:hypothetical protein